MNTDSCSNPECPDCRQALTPLDGSTGSLRCDRCGSVLVQKTELQPDFWEPAVPAETARETSETAKSEKLNCPVCGSSVERLRIEDAPVGRCTGCGGAWLEQAPNFAEAAGTRSGFALGRYLLYTMTLPERSLRSAIGLAGGVAKETAEWLVPQAFQSSKTYEIVVRNSLRFLTEDIAGVAGQAEEPATADDYLARKAVGNFVDLAGLATLHVSPLWLLAIASDVAYGSRAYVLELAEELKREGIIDETSTIHHVDDVLAAVQQTSGEAAGLFDTPPLSVEQMQQTLDQTRAAASSADFRKQNSTATGAKCATLLKLRR